MKIRTLSLLLALALCSNAFASEPEKSDAAEQQATKAEIDSLLARIRELSKKLGPDHSVVIDVRKFDHDGAAAGMHGPGNISIERRLAPMAGMGEMHRQSMQPKPGIGIVMTPNAAANGVIIGAVSPDGPAAKAGLRSGDVLLKINGKTIAGSGKEGVGKARDLLSDLKVGQGVQVTYARAGKTGTANVKVDNIGRVMMFSTREGNFAPQARIRERHMSVAPGGQQDIEIMAFADCEKSGKKGCAPPHIFEAMRWQGLNLASIDAQLGRYFGTEKGVLVISAGPGMKTLQGGDVIQRVEASATESPRDVMRVLRDKKAGEKVSLQVLRERKTLNLEITAPEARALQFLPPPPAPPLPPHGPGTPTPPAPPAPPTGMLFDKPSMQNIAWVGETGQPNAQPDHEAEMEIVR